MDCGVLKYWFSNKLIKENDSGVDSGVLKCWFPIGSIKGNVSVVDTGVPKCWLYVAYIKENVLCSGFWCVKMLIFYCFYMGKCIMSWILVCQNVDFLLVVQGKMYSVVDSGVLKCWFSIGFIWEDGLWGGFWCVKMLIFHLFLKRETCIM